VHRRRSPGQPPLQLERRHRRTHALTFARAASTLAPTGEVWCLNPARRGRWQLRAAATCRAQVPRRREQMGEGLPLARVGGRHSGLSRRARSSRPSATAGTCPRRLVGMPQGRTAGTRLVSAPRPTRRRTTAQISCLRVGTRPAASQSGTDEIGRAARSLPSLRTSRNTGSDVLDERSQRTHAARDVPSVRCAPVETSACLLSAEALDGREPTGHSRRLRSGGARGGVLSPIPV
jgi:hypothetical protein